MSDAALAQEPPAPPANEPPATPPSTPPAASAPPAQPPKPTAVQTPPSAPPAEPKAYWPDDWRAKIAGTDDKRNPLRKTLETFQDPAAIANSMMELRRRWDEGGHVKLPGKDAKPEDIAAFHKAMGVPDKPEGYLEQFTPENGAILGDADKPLASSFAAEMHKVGAPPAAVNQALNWYFKNQEEQAAALDESDETFRAETERALKEEYGPTFTRFRNAIPSLFMNMPGGSSAEDSFFANLVSGRTADGKIIGNHPDFIKFMVGLVREINPVAAVTESGDATGTNIDDEIAGLEKRMRDDRNGYFKDERAQARYRELLDARARHRARNAA